MNRILLAAAGLLLLFLLSCRENSPTDTDSKTEMNINDEAIKSVLMEDSTDLLFNAIDDQSESEFGDEPNWLGNEALGKTTFHRPRFGRIMNRPVEHTIDIVYNDDSTATAHIHSVLKGKFVTLLPDTSADTLIFVRYEKPLEHVIDRVVFLRKFRDLPDRRRNWRIKNISMAEGISVPNSVEIMNVTLYPEDQDSMVIDDPFDFLQNGVSLLTFPRWTTLRIQVSVRNTSPDPVVFPEGTGATEIVRLHFGRNRLGHHGRSILEWAGTDGEGNNVYEGNWTVMQFRGYHHAVIDVIANGTILESDADAYPYNSNTWSTPYRVTPF